MSTERLSYKVTILDEQYALVSNESADHLMSVATFVDALMRDSVSKNAHMDTKKVAVLIALQLASQLINLKRDMEKRDGHHANTLNTVERMLTTFMQ